MSLVVRRIVFDLANRLLFLEWLQRTQTHTHITIFSTIYCGVVGVETVVRDDVPVQID